MHNTGLVWLRASSFAVTSGAVPLESLAQVPVHRGRVHLGGSQSVYRYCAAYVPICPCAVLDCVFSQVLPRLLHHVGGPRRPVFIQAAGLPLKHGGCAWAARSCSVHPDSGADRGASRVSSCVWCNRPWSVEMRKSSRREVTHDGVDTV